MINMTRRTIAGILLLVFLYIMIALMSCRARKEKEHVDLAQVKTSKSIAKSDSTNVKTQLVLKTIQLSDSKGRHLYNKKTTTEYDPNTSKPIKKTVEETGETTKDMNASVNTTSDLTHSLAAGSIMNSLSDSTSIALKADKKVKLSENKYLQIGVILVLLAIVYGGYRLFSASTPGKIIKSAVVDKRLLA